MTRSVNVPCEPDDSKAPCPVPGTVAVVLVGNTATRVVAFAGEARDHDARLPTADVLAGADLEVPAGRPVVLVSVVPAANPSLIARFGPTGITLLDARTVGLPMACAGMGADRLANALALWRAHGAGVAVDCGTATTLTLVDATGTIRGGAIMPGLGTARDVLARATAQLPAVELHDVASPWGTNTDEAIRIGLIHGHVGAIAHLVARMRPATGHVVVTGGWSGLLSPLLPFDHVQDLDLTITGGRLALP